MEQSNVQISSLSEKVVRHFNLKILFGISVVFRGLLLIYGEWQDSKFAVKFTDIDYHVFSDGAKHVVDGKSPFLRPTYRYTPLLAILLTLNHHLFFSFGKILFVCCDLGVAILILRILTMRGVGKIKKTFSILLWLLNPLTATVSSRGNAESVISILVLLTLYFLICRRIYFAAFFFGVAIHVKIFPIIYSLSLFLFIDDNCTTNTNLQTSPLEITSAFRRFLSPLRLKFTYISVVTFIVITSYLYILYGDEFIEEAYLYHITRRDTRHNFSVYFYMLYLIQNTWLSLPVGILSFVPQAVLLFATSIWLYRDITLCCFIQTFIFVTFNKVCTSQYFLWYLCLLPLVTPYSKLHLQEAIAMATLWFVGQGLWLLPAYLLEFRGHNTFMLIWLAGLAFFHINMYLLIKLLKNQTITPTFISGRIVSQQKKSKS